MKQVLAILCVLAAIAAIAACDLGGGGGSNGYSVVTGIIQVPDATYWDYIKLGVFSGGEAGTYSDVMGSYLDTEENGGGVRTYRLYYSNLNNAADAPVSPETGTVYNISGSDATQRSYSFELPATLPGRDESYYFAAWYDDNDDNILDLVDHWDTAVIPNGEYNRCAARAAVDDVEGPPRATELVIDHFEQSRDLSDNLTGNYKYVGYDEFFPMYNEQEELTSDDHGGFNFYIANNFGW